MVVSLTTAKFKPLVFFKSGFVLFYTEHVHSHDFVRLLLVAGTILLYNRVHTEGARGSVVG
jgi:hypothetical protein